jgi:hypothetical protein
MKSSLRLTFALLLASSLYAAGPHRPITIVFDNVLGMPVITIETSQGKRRFVLDTGSNISTMNIKKEKALSVSVAGKKFTQKFKPTQTQAFDEFRAMLPSAEHVDGILGSDFMGHFHRVIFDFRGDLVSFE